MDIEKLTKMQIVLLTLLVSFVTSIATGIVTVTLMDQAPPAMTQTLNRVVERTVERVVPDNSKQGASVITKETTVVVKEEDLITDSINKNSKSVVRIKNISEDGKVGSLLGLGIIVSKDGIIATDTSVIKNSSKYIIETASGEIFNANTIEIEESVSPMFLLIEISEADVGGEKKIFQPVVFSKSNSFKLGQTVLSLTGEERTDVAIGIIAGLIEEDIVIDPPAGNTENTDITKEIQKPETTKVLSIIKTSIGEKDVIVGSPLIDIFGEVIGISTGNSLTGKTALFAPTNNIRSTVSKIINAKSKTQDTKKIEQ
jgi:S1-C subfamily serine protease